MNLPTSKTKLILFGGIGAIFLALLMVFMLGSKKPVPPIEPVSLTFWGVYDDKEVYDTIIKEFMNIKPKTSISYRKLPPQEYQRAIIEALASGKGPDIIMVPNSEIFKNKEILISMPPCIVYNKIYQKYFVSVADIIPPLPRKTPQNNCEYTSVAFKKELYKNILKNYGNNFVDVAAYDFIFDDKVYALPLYVDTLALFYNKDHFYAANIPSPPSTWKEFIETVLKLRRIRPDGSIERAAVALGDTKTVHRAVDIFIALAMQSGASLIDLEKSKVSLTEGKISSKGQTILPVVDALNFYFAFSNPSFLIDNKFDVYTWNNRQNYSIDAFTRGELSMMFGYSYIIPDLKSKNAYLNFGIAPFPQLEPDLKKKVTYADYFGVAVTNKVLSTIKQGKICAAKCQTAWEFLIFLTNFENSKKYSQQAFRPTARRDLINFQSNDPELGVFASQSLTAKSWRRPDKALVEQILIDAMDDVIKNGKSAYEALKTAEDRIRVLLPQTRN